MAQRVFHTEGITKVYHTGEIEVHALRGVDTELFMGEFTVLLGASGSGKSTLLNILGGSIRRRMARRGSATWNSPRCANAT